MPTVKTLMQPEEYVEQRLNEQIEWYDVKSRLARRRYRLLRVLEIVVAASIPIISGFGGLIPYATLVVAVAGVVVTVVAGLLSLYRYQEVWVSYRSTCESLRREKFLYLTRTPPYDTPSPLPLLVQQVEGLVSQENVNWNSYIRSMPPAAAEPATTAGSGGGALLRPTDGVVGGGTHGAGGGQND